MAFSTRHLLGWNDRVLDIIRELVIANESESDATIVILAEKDKVEMDDIIATGIEELKTTRVITRRGSGATLSNLRRVAAKEAKSAILLSRAKESDNEEERRSADARVLKTILALISCQGGHNSMSIVVDIHYQSNRELLKTFEDPLITAIDNWDILAKILVQTSRTTGLAMVYDEILSFRGCELYFYKANWKNLPFCELAFHFQDGVPIGVRKAAGTLILKPGQESVMEPEDEVLLIAEDDSSIHFAESPVVRPEELPFTLQRREKQVERELILGWHIMTKNIIREYTDYLMEGSTVDIMVPNPSEELIREIVELQEENTTLTINPIDLNPMSITQLKQVDPFSYDNIIVLSQTTRGASAERVDSETLFILLLLRKVHKELERPGESQTTIITQVLNSENQELITQTEVDDFLISNKIVTMIYAQLSEEAGMRQVYEDIFAEEGSEIYVKPVTLYFPQLPVKARFADLIALACKRDEICIGIRLGEHAHHPDKNFGITLNPAKDAVFTLDDDDSLVVLAEDEL